MHKEATNRVPGNNKDWGYITHSPAEPERIQVNNVYFLNMPLITLSL
jgi:hypothetical protein